MPKDKYSAVWVSHTSISDFLKCPRGYYLKNVYKDPKTNHKIKLMSPPLALGQSVHEVLESLSKLRKEERFSEPLPVKFDRAWEKVSGKKGGFFDTDSEYRYKQRGLEMLKRVWNNPGPIKRSAVKIQQDLPYYWISEEENIILCGKVDWLEYLEATDSIHIIDFKTGKNEEEEGSLQLPIYHLLVANTQKRQVTKASYWYLDHDDELTEKTLPSLEEAHDRVLAVAQQMKLARQLGRFKCPEGERGCFHCLPMEDVVNGKAEFVGLDDYSADVYIMDRTKLVEEEMADSIIL